MLSFFCYKSNLNNSFYDRLGFCWGSYPVVRLSADPRVKAGVSMHPSHPKVCEQLQEDEEAILKDIKCPQFFLPADGDSPTTKFGGIGKKVLGDALEIKIVYFLII